MKIRRVNASDVNELQALAKCTFAEAFAADNSQQNLTTYIDNNFSLQKLTAELNDQNSEFFFAELDQTAIGYLKLNCGEAQTEFVGNQFLEIERIYVVKQFYGKKVGQSLFNKAIEVAQQKQLEYVWLGVWEQNSRAIRFYQKNGFVEFGKHQFMLGDDKQTDLMMKLKIESD